MLVSSALVDVERLADHVEHVAEHAVADRHGDAVAGVAHDRAALEAVGRLQADGAHAAVADLLRDLGGDGDRLALELGVHLDREVDLGQRVGRELDVDDRAGDRDDAAVLRAVVSGVSAVTVMLQSPTSSDSVRCCGEQVGVAGFDGVGEEVVGHELRSSSAAPRRRRRSP